MARGIDLETQQPLRLVEELDGFSCIAVDKAATREHGRMLTAFHVGMMLAFVTIVLAPFAWLAALANILLTPKVVANVLTCTQHGVRIGRWYGRASPSIEDLRAKDSAGPGLFGLGAAPEPVLLPFSEVERVGWTEYSLVFGMRDGEQHEVVLELTPREDIARLGQRIEQVWRDATEQMSLTPEQADEQRRSLARLAGRTALE